MGYMTISVLEAAINMGSERCNMSLGTAHMSQFSIRVKTRVPRERPQHQIEINFKSAHIHRCRGGRSDW